jgi:hypothetical protein
MDAFTFTAILCVFGVILIYYYDDAIWKKRREVEEAKRREELKLRGLDVIKKCLDFVFTASPPSVQSTEEKKKAINAYIDYLDAYIYTVKVRCDLSNSETEIAKLEVIFKLKKHFALNCHVFD